MELIARIFETLGITQLALLQMALVVVLAFALSSLLIKPILATFEERENLSTKPLEESRRVLAEAEGKSKAYEEALRKASADALASRRKRLEEASRAERKRFEAASEDANREVEGLRGRIEVEKEKAAAALRAGTARLSIQIAEKVLGRRVA